MMTEEQAREAVGAALAQAGLGDASIWDLVNHKVPSTPAIPALLELIPRLPECRQAEGVLRAVTDKATPESSLEILLDAYDRFQERSIRWAAANAIRYIWGGKSKLGELIKRARDRDAGPARQNLVAALARSKTREAISTLIDVLDDDAVVLHALGALARKDAALLRELGAEDKLAGVVERMPTAAAATRAGKLLARLQASAD